MFRKSELSRLFSLPTSTSIRLNTNRRSQRRTGRAVTEVALIILVPCFCLLLCALFDAEFRKSLLAGPNNNDGMLSVNPVYDAVNMDDDMILTVQGQGQLRFWNLKQTVLLGAIQSHLSEVRCAAYSESQRLIAVGSATGTLELWDLEHPESPRLTDDPLHREISDCQFTAEGTTLLTAGDEGKVVIWDPRTLVPVGTLESADPQESMRCLDISPDSKYVASGTYSGVVRIWDLEHRKLVHSHRVTNHQCRPDAAVEAVNFLADNRTFICATHNDGVAVWDIETGACIQRLGGPLFNLRSGTLSQDESWFLAGSKQGRIVAWNLETGNRTEVLIPNATTVRALACNADAKTLLIGDWNGSVQFWNEPRPGLAVGLAITQREAYCPNLSGRSSRKLQQNQEN